MQTNNRLFDDLAKVAGGALSSLASLGEEASARLREQVERVLAGMDLVRRDEFEAVRDMAVKARAENEALAARLAAIEKGTAAPGKPARKRRTAPKTAPSTKAGKGAKPTS